MKILVNKRRIFIYFLILFSTFYRLKIIININIQNTFLDNIKIGSWIKKIQG